MSRREFPARGRSGRTGKKGRTDRADRIRRAVESLETRQLLAAHIVGNPTTFATIQAAIDAAPTGATINVDPGNYTEQVVVYNAVNLRGAMAGVDGRSNARGSGVGESVITGTVGPDGNTSYAFRVASNDCTIDGFTVQGQTSISSATGAGIVLAPNIAGTHIVNNIVQNNVSGLYLSNNSATDAALIQHNIFRSNNNNPGNAPGRGIYTDGGVSGGTLTNVTIDSNFFWNNLGDPTFLVQPAIGLEALTAASIQSNIRITNNVFDRNGKAVLAFNASNLTIDGNVIGNHWDVSSAALRLEGNTNNVTITHNNMYASGGRAIYIDKKASSGDNTNYTITDNNIYKNGLEPEGQNTGLYIGALSYTGTLDAANNWWGSSDGPSGDFTGTGDAVFANGNSVNVQPFATTPALERQYPWFGVASVTGSPIEAENFDHGMEGVPYHDTTAGNSGGSYRPNIDVDIATSSDTGGAYMVTSTKAGEWIEYALNVASAGTYEFDARLQSTSSGAAFHIELDGSNVSGSVSIPSNAGWQTLAKTGVNLSSGLHIMRLVFDTQNSGGNVGDWNWFQFIQSGSIQPPAAPSGLAASAASSSQINLTWTDNSNNETSFILERSTDNVTFTQVATPAQNATSYNDTNLLSSTLYYYRIRATNAVGPSANSNVASATTLVSTALPSPYIDGDIGTTGAAGSGAYTNGVFTIQGAGSNVAGTADSFNYVYKSWSGSGQIIARVASSQAGNPGAAFAGVMFRDSLAANAKQASLLLKNNGQASFVSRTSTGGAAVAASVSASLPSWIKVIRSGNSYTAYRSTDGVTWTQVGLAVTIAMGAKVYVGLLVCSTAPGTLATFTLDSVTTSTSTSSTLAGTPTAPAAPAPAFNSSTFNSTTLIQGTSSPNSASALLDSIA